MHCDSCCLQGKGTRKCGRVTYKAVVTAIVITDITTRLVLAVGAARDAALAIGGNETDQGSEDEGNQLHFDGLDCGRELELWDLVIDCELSR